MSTTVKYNGQSIVPAPLVGRNFAGIDYGNRWGYVEDFELKGYLTGVAGTGAVNTINSIFNSQPGTLLVESDGTPVISGLNCFVEDISLDQSNYGIGKAVPYSIRLKTYNIPSGIIEPSNKYSFEFDGGDIVGVSHTVSAKGVKNDSMALLNAINFVNQFVGKDPYSSCAPIFIEGGTGVLISRSESINRLEGMYSVTETFQYNTGSTNDYVETTSLEVNESAQSDYPSFDITISYLGSQIDSDVDSLLTSISGLNPLDKISKIYGYDTGNFLLGSHQIDINSGENKVSISSSYTSGLSGDISGFFDSSIDMSWDEITDIMTFNINGTFESRGSQETIQANYEAFKSANGSSYSSYVYNLITGSYLGKTYLTGHELCPYPLSLEITDNTGQYKLSLSASFNNRDYLTGIQNTTYTVNADASKWVFSLIPSVNIEGHYAIQDLNCKSRERSSFAISCTHSGDYPLSLLEDLNSRISGAVFSTPPFLLNADVNSGEFDLDISREYIGDENIPRLTQGKLASSRVLKTYLRATGQKFGY